MNRELGADFNPAHFKHYAYYNPSQGRVEMHLISLHKQTININGTAISISKGESIHTENSYKYNLEEFALLAARAGFEVEKTWTDTQKWFSVLYCVNRSGNGS